MDRNLRNQFREFDDPRKQELSRRKVCLRNLGRLRLNPWAVKDNLVYDDLETTIEEVLRFKELGGRTIVDCTSLGLGRDVTRLRQVALRTGVNVIAGSGYYTRDTHPAQFASWPLERIAERIVGDLTEGVDGSGIRAGVIGEVGTSDPIHPDEWKSLEAAAIAFRQTGAPIQVHTYPWGKAGLEAVDLLLAKGVDPGKLVICHLDVEPDPDYIRTVLTRGVFVQFDNFGKEFSG